MMKDATTYAQVIQDHIEDLVEHINREMLYMGGFASVASDEASFDMSSGEIQLPVDNLLSDEVGAFLHVNSDYLYVYKVDQEAVRPGDLIYVTVSLTDAVAIAYNLTRGLPK